MQRRGVVLARRPVLALDLGGTQIRAAAVRPDGALASRVARPTPGAEGPEAVVRACLDALREARDAAPREVAAALSGIGISAPGPVDPRSGVVLEPPNIAAGFVDVPLAGRVAEALGLPAALDRDTNVAALAEGAFGAAVGVRDYVYVTISTGIGGAVVIGGRLLHGPSGTAGEIGHLPVMLDGPPCGCGGHGHLEAVASGIALARAARAAAASGASGYLALAAEARGAAALSARDVVAGAAAGDVACDDMLDLARRAIAAVAAGLVNVLNPRRLVVGGSLAVALGEQLLGEMRQEIARSAFRTPAGVVRVVQAALGDDVGLVGAVPLVELRLAQPAAASRRGAARPRASTIPTGRVPVVTS